MAEARELYPSVVIGLGGTGSYVVQRLKQLLLDDFSEPPPHVALLSIDSTAHKEGTGLGLAPLVNMVERINLGIPQTEAVNLSRSVHGTHPWRVKEDGVVLEGLGDVKPVTPESIASKILALPAILASRDKPDALKAHLNSLPGIPQWSRQTVPDAALGNERRHSGRDHAMRELVR